MPGAVAGEQAAAHFGAAVIETIYAAAAALTGRVVADDARNYDRIAFVAGETAAAAVEVLVAGGKIIDNIAVADENAAFITVYGAAGI